MNTVIGRREIFGKVWTVREDDSGIFVTPHGTPVSLYCGTGRAGTAILRDKGNDGIAGRRMISLFGLELS
jgi:hypothetical protein